MKWPLLVSFIQKVLMHSSYLKIDEPIYFPELEILKLHTSLKVTYSCLKIQDVLKFDGLEAWQASAALEMTKNLNVKLKNIIWFICLSI